MRIKFLGASGTVTGSGYVLTSQSGQSILIDLGMFQGPAATVQLNYKKIDYDLSKLSGAILTHAHLDHCGRIPVLFSHGFKNNVWMTPPTKDLSEVTLFDSAKVAKQDGREILYDRKLVETTIEAFRKINYDTNFLIGDFSIVFRDASHILGSASVEIEDKSATGEMRRIVFSGDLGNPDMDLLPPASEIKPADAVVMESTYGDRLHPDENPSAVLAREINAVEATGGTLLLPTFSLEKTQEILHWLKKLKQDRKILSQTPIFLDSPMAIKATRVYEDYPNLFAPLIQQEFKNSRPFQFPGLYEISSRESQGLIERERGPKVIMAGSGMMMGGKILTHALRYLPIASTRILILGYQGEETRGREVQEGAKTINIDGSDVLIRATVNHTESMSSHADQGQLMNWLKKILGVKKVVLTHGEDPQRQELSQIIKNDLQISDVVMPLLNQEVEI